MKVLVVTNMYPTPERVYYGIFVKEFIESLRKAGAAIDCFFTDGSRRRSNYLRDVPLLARTLATGGYEIVHLQHTFCVYQYRAAAARAGTRLPAVLTVHEGEIRASSRPPLSLDRIVFSRRIKKWAMNGVDHVVAVEESLPHLVGYKEPFTVIPPGIDMEMFRPMDRDECRRRIGVPRGARAIFFPVDPKKEPHKGFDLVEKALAGMADPPRVVFGGSIPHAEMPAVMNGVDAVVQVSRFEASPMIVKEAMACNVPMVSSDVGDVRAIFGDTPGCYLCERDPKDIAAAIGRALSDPRPPAGRERIGTLNLSLAAVAARYLALYESIIYSHRGKP